jgi:hypothetical protein
LERRRYLGKARAMMGRRFALVTSVAVFVDPLSIDQELLESPSAKVLSNSKACCGPHHLTRRLFKRIAIPQGSPLRLAMPFSKPPKLG